MMGSYPLFPIPENGVAMGNHIENSAPALPIRAHLTSDATIMTDNPAFASPIEEDTPPPIPPYRSNSFSDSDSSQPPLHIHTHHHAQDPHPPIPPRIHSSHSVPFLGESFSQVQNNVSVFISSQNSFERERESMCVCECVCVCGCVNVWVCVDVLV